MLMAAAALAGSLIAVVGPALLDPTPAGADTTYLPPDLINLAGLQAQPTDNGLLYPGGIYAATGAQITSLENLETQAVSGVLAQHALPASDAATVLSWARPDAEAELWALLNQALEAVNSDTATTDQTNAVDWMTTVYDREAQLAAQDAGLEYTKWAGTGSTAAYDELLASNPSETQLQSYLDATPQPYADGASYDTASSAVDGGYCVYVAPSPDQSDYTANIYTTNATSTTPQTCYTGCTSEIGCSLPTPAYSSFTQWGAADADEDLFGNANYAADVDGIAQAGSVEGAALAIAPAAGAVTAAAFSPVINGTAFQQAVFPFAARLAANLTPDDAALETSGEGLAEAAEDTLEAVDEFAFEVAATGVGAIVAAIIFAVTTAVQEGLMIFQGDAVPGELASDIAQAGTGTNLPASYAASDSSTMQTLFALFTGSTEPDPTFKVCDNADLLIASAQPCLNATPVPTGSNDPEWVVTPEGGTAAAPQATITTGPSLTGLAQSTSLYGNWFVDTANVPGANGQETAASIESLRFAYTDWSGNEQYAWLYSGLAPPEFLTVAASALGANFDPETCLSQDICTMSPTIDFVGSDGNNYSASVTETLPADEAPPIPTSQNCTSADDSLGTLCTSSTGGADGTTTTVTGPAATNVGQPVTYTATVDAVAGSDSAVTFTDGTQTLCAGVSGNPITAALPPQYTAQTYPGEPTGIVITPTTYLDATVYTCTTSFDESGSAYVFATFSGDNIGNNPSQGELTTAVGTGLTTGAVDLVDDYSVFGSVAVGQSDIFTAEIASGGAVPPTGTVGFSDGGYVLCANAPITTREALGITYYAASCPVAWQGTGPQTVTATYGGDANNLGGSQSEEINVTPADGVVTVTASPAPQAGASVTWTATVGEEAPAGEGPTPIGLVTFTDGNGDTLCSDVLLNNGAATCTQTYQDQGPQSVTAAYQGDTYTNPSSSTGQITIAPDVTATVASLTTAGPYVVGEPVTVSATVTQPAFGGSRPGFLPTGTVTFTSTAVPADTCTGTLDAGYPDTASCILTYQGPIHDSVTAAYHGDTNNAGSDGGVAITVNQDATSVSVSALPPSPVVGQSVVYTATVSVTAPGSSTPAGDVTFSDNNGLLCASVPVTPSGTSSATAQCSGTFGSAASDDITAGYSGDANERLSSGLGGLIYGQDSTTTTLLTPNPAAPVVGQSVAVSATVAVDAPGAGAPTGFVTFSGDGTSCGASLGATAPYTAGCSLVVKSAATSGTLSATYNGDSDDTGSITSTGLPVAQASTGLSVSATPSAARVGQTISLSATVSPVAPGSGTPTGSITFRGKSGTLCVASLNEASPDTATCSTAYAGPTTDSVTATYAGDSNFKGSSASTPVTVTQASSSTTLTASASPSVSGQTITFTASVGAVAPASGTPAGTVTFSFTDADKTSQLPKCHGSAGDVVTLSGGTATCTISGLAVAQSPLGVRAAYSGSAAFSNSSASLGEPITKASTSITLKSSQSPLPNNSAVTFTAVIAVLAPGAGTPNGEVTWEITSKSGAPVQCRSTTTATSGQALDATCHLSASETRPSGSPYAVKATYGGNANLLGSNGTLLETVK
jgi:hypothetical protein